MTKKTQKLRKVLTLAACAVLLVCVTIAGTVAYLTSDDTVTNTFTVGKVEITLDEGAVYEFGKTEENQVHGKHTDDGATRVTENTYKLFPGHEYDKDPIVHVTAESETCYVFVQVINNIAEIEDATTIADQIVAYGWQKLSVDGVEGDLYYKVSANGDADRDLEVFDTVKIKGTVDNDTLEDYEDKTVVINAYAIQYDGFADAAAAWTAGNDTAANGGWLE